MPDGADVRRRAARPRCGRARSARGQAGRCGGAVEGAAKRPARAIRSRAGGVASRANGRASAGGVGRGCSTPAGQSRSGSRGDARGDPDPVRSAKSDPTQPSACTSPTGRASPEADRAAGARPEARAHATGGPRSPASRSATVEQDAAESAFATPGGPSSPAPATSVRNAARKRARGRPRPTGSEPPVRAALARDRAIVGNEVAFMRRMIHRPPANGSADDDARNARALPGRRSNSRGRTRTCDTVVNSHLLCQLSYAGSGCRC